MKIKIGIAGAHSTGKTTLLGHVTERLSAAGYSVARVSDLASEARQHNFPILREHTFASTLWIIARGISRELEEQIKADVVLVDRPVPDALGYLRAALEYRNASLPKAEVDYLEQIVRMHSSQYTKLFKTQIDPERGIADDKIRDLDERFRLLAAKGIDSVFEELEIPVFGVPMNPHEARETVLESIMSALKA